MMRYGAVALKEHVVCGLNNVSFNIRCYCGWYLRILLVYVLMF